MFKKDGEPLLSRRKSHHIGSNYGNGILQSNLVRQFYMELKEPHRIWKPDEYINGEAILHIKKDVTNIAIKLTLVSEIKAKAGAGATGRKKMGEMLLEKSTFLYGEELVEKVHSKESFNGLTKGEHRFPFRIKVPSGKKVFSSIRFERGSISYYLQCSVETMGPNQAEKISSRCEQGFSVIVPLDVSNLPEQKTKTVVLQSASMVRHANRSPGDGSSSFLTKVTNPSTNSNSSSNTINSTHSVDKTVTISVDISHAGFAIGEIIPIDISVKHYKNFCHPAGLIVTLARICRVSGGGKDEPMETFRKDICQSISPLYVDPETFDISLTVYLKVPIDAFSTFTSFHKYFTFQYYVEVMVNLSQKNVVYTESNRVIGSPNDTANSKRETGTSELEGNINQMQRKFLNIVSTEMPIKDESNIESNIFYQDMVNVEKLKRLNNVTGMSIETVIGTTRSQSKENKQNIEAEQAIEAEHTESPLTSNTASPKRATDEWLSPLYAYDNYPPVPQYTPNSAVTVEKDKRELEQTRLKQLESDPPTENY